jgi:hypothetical protein
MAVALNLAEEALARLDAEASRRGVTVEMVINEFAEQPPLPADSTARRAAGLIGLGASSSGQHAGDADAILADGFGTG